MNNLAKFTILSSALMCAFAGESQAQQWRVVPGENMVMLPPDDFLETGRYAPAAINDGEGAMVVVPTAPSAARPDKSSEAPLADTFASITGPDYVEAGVNFYDVSNNQGDWLGEFVKGQIQTDERNRWNAQLQHQEAFHDNGVFFGVGNTHTFNDRWFSDVGIGMGSDTLILPRYRADAAINHKLLPAGNMIATLGTTWMKASQTYESIGLFGGLSYYFDGPWNAQIGLRSDRSTPGGVYATSGFTALTYGYNKRHYLTGRVSYGREAYQLLGAGNITSAFNSHTLGLNWRQWIGESWGYNIGGEYYKNPTYDRTGGTFSLFKEF